jgi:enamine deaminase RidA (YjgF/YER057c/UK114 family)
MPRPSYVQTPPGVAPGFGYSQVVFGSGRLVVVAGQIARDENGELVGRGDPVAQTRQVFENLRRCLAAAGATFEDVVKLSYFVTDASFLPAIRDVRDEYVDTENPPASTAVQVAALFAPDYLVEIEAMALVDDSP